MIDHSLLNPTLTVPDLEEGIRVAGQYEVASAYAHGGDTRGGQAQVGAPAPPPRALGGHDACQLLTHPLVAAMWGRPSGLLARADFAGQKPCPT